MSKYYDLYSECIADCTKMGTERVFSYQQKLSYLFYKKSEC